MFVWPFWCLLFLHHFVICRDLSHLPALCVPPIVLPNTAAVSGLCYRRTVPSRLYDAVSLQASLLCVASAEKELSFGAVTGEP